MTESIRNREFIVMRMPFLLISFIASLLFAGCSPPPEPAETAAQPENADQVTEPAANPEPTVTAQVIRVMSLNIHHGRGTDGKVDIERIGAMIKDAKPDIVGLQELDRWVTRSGGVDQIGELARITDMSFYFDKNISYQGGDYGNAILTRFPILQQTNTYYKSRHPGERRGLLQVVLDVNGRKLVFMNTHMDYRPEDEERLMNIGQIEQAMEAYAGLPIILTGDLNDDPDSRTHRRFKELFVDAWEVAGEGLGYTYDGPDRSKRLDYIMLSKTDALEVVKIHVIQTGVSDHRPVVADIRLK